jgi:hypothetical protein
MNSFLQIINERAPTEALKYAEVLVNFITGKMDVAEMRTNRGKDFSSTNMYQIRVKPNDRETDLQSILTQLQKILKSAEAKKLGIKDVEINDTSVNSSKYSSVSFEAVGTDYDVVVAKGGNGGEHFEQDLLLSMDNFVAGIESTDEAQKAFAALEAVDKAFKLSNVVGVSKRTGTTKRSGDLSPEETGKIIGDVIVTLKKGGEKYISVKDSNGKTVAQFGLAKAFNEDLTVNTSSPEWKQWLAPFGLDHKKIEAGLKAAQDGTELDFPDIETTSKKVKPGSPIQKIMEKLWGCDYYYLRKNGKDFKALKIDKSYVDEELLKNLHVTEIRYPSSARKQINIYLNSSTMNFKLEVRNPRGKGSVKPTQIQLTIMKGVK